ncbi:MAG: protocatechuate 3,4-dioxygenase [Pseudomonadota bacterium]
MTESRSILRRSILLAAPAILTTPVATLAALEPTPIQTEGPFYPRVIPDDRDADLVTFNGRDFDGEVIEMVGQVFDLARDPIAGAVVEIWHCDPAGIYPHVGRNNGGWADPGFQGYGAVATGADGRYTFRTIRPGVYPGRVRHIHVRIMRKNGKRLSTQMYFPEEDNAGDFLFRRGGNALIAERIDAPQARYQFDLFIG